MSNFVCKPLLREDEVADLLKVSEKTVNRWWQSGTTCLQVTYLGGRSKRYLTASVEQFITVGRVNPDDLLKE